MDEAAYGVQAIMKPHVTTSCLVNFYLCGVIFPCRLIITAHLTAALRKILRTTEILLEIGDKIAVSCVIIY